MRVHFVLPPIERFSPVDGGAISTFVWQMARRLASAGHEACVVSPSGGSPVYADVPAVTFRSPDRSGLGAVRRAVSKVDRVCLRRDWMYYDVYVDRLLKACRSLPEADWWVGFNDLQIGMVLKSKGLKGQMALRLSNECQTKKADWAAVFSAYRQVFTVSDYIRTWTAGRYPGVGAEGFCVLPNGADLEHYGPRDGFLLPAEPVKVLFVGRIDPNKGPDVVVEAVKAVRRASPGAAVLSVVGGRWFYGDYAPNAYEQRLFASAAEIEAELHGHVEREDLPEIVRKHDVLIMPSKSNEPMGQVQFEAMASGLAVVASNRGGIPESLGDAGVQVDPDRPDDVAGALKRMVDDQGWLADQKRLSVERARQMSWDHTFSRFCRGLEGARAGALRTESPKTQAPRRAN